MTSRYAAAFKDLVTPEGGKRNQSNGLDCDITGNKNDNEVRREEKHKNPNPESQSDHFTSRPRKTRLRLTQLLTCINETLIHRQNHTKNKF